METNSILKSYHTKGVCEAGCDEAGRGCLAGPVVAAAVILPPRFKHPVLRDSKLLTAKQRNELADIVKSKSLAWAIAVIDNEEIDQINILRASIKAMHKALSCLSMQPEHILIDGHIFYPYNNVRHTCVIKGDNTYFSIAAASVLAKTYRDSLMKGLHESYPHYLWSKNKGYPTLEHRSAIMKFGISPYHRKSFQLIGDQLTLPFAEY